MRAGLKVVLIGSMFVIHEALHHAGLTEKPQDRRGMTSLAINSMVGRSCGF